MTLFVINSHGMNILFPSSALIDSIRNRTTREKLGLTYICGAVLIRDAIRKGVLLPEIYFHNSIDLQALPHQLLINAGVEFVPVSKESFTKDLNAEHCTDGLLGKNLLYIP